jgi:hypothetical protein
MTVRVVNDFVSQDDCKMMIDRLEHLIAIEDVVVRKDGRIGVINKEDPIFSFFVEKYKKKAIETFDDEYVNLSGYIATKYVKDVGMDVHIDSRPGEEMGVLMYLNDDYVGGELTYVDDNGDSYSVAPKTGDAVYCPSWYPHGVNKVIDGNRYFFTVSLLSKEL